MASPEDTAWLRRFSVLVRAEETITAPWEMSAPTCERSAVRVCWMLLGLIVMNPVC